MSLREAIRESGRKGPRCTYATKRETLDDETRAELDECMADDSLTSAAIARGLGTVGVNISSATVQRHRRGECHCGRVA